MPSRGCSSFEKKVPKPVPLMMPISMDTKAMKGSRVPMAVWTASRAAWLKVATTLPAPRPIFARTLALPDSAICSESFFVVSMPFFSASGASASGAASWTGASDPSAREMLALVTPET